MYMNGKHWNINADHVVLIEQRDWAVSYAYVTMCYIVKEIDAIIQDAKISNPEIFGGGRKISLSNNTAAIYCVKIRNIMRRSYTIIRCSGVFRGHSAMTAFGQNKSAIRKKSRKRGSFFVEAFKKRREIPP